MAQPTGITFRGIDVFVDRDLASNGFQVGTALELQSYEHTGHSVVDSLIQREIELKREYRSTSRIVLSNRLLTELKHESKELMLR
jgi:hypothetical protein